MLRPDRNHRCIARQPAGGAAHSAPFQGAYLHFLTAALVRRSNAQNQQQLYCDCVLLPCEGKRMPAYTGKPLNTHPNS